MCSCFVIWWSRTSLPGCGWLYSNINQVTIELDRPKTLGVFGIHSRLDTMLMVRASHMATWVYKNWRMDFPWPVCADEEVENMIARGRLVRCLFVYASETQPCSATKGILWELQRKVRHFHQSTETFWLHNGTVVNRDLIPFSDWRPPMPLP